MFVIGVVSVVVDEQMENPCHIHNTIASYTDVSAFVGSNQNNNNNNKYITTFRITRQHCNQFNTTGKWMDKFDSH